ncbi:PHB depolymerase family esterase [Exilibacterium tricleocarpae]|uniref:PHB depolymerase family esterase n=1 Tax=Exilibacterium tricleocarpae TaxID=2591008 RepID=A0A545TZN4_9GAMM|nr:PHB depolymerase family esterase [Exilibacterium tricleocarpae]TQV82676.1 PHB depolymerase family esterase [Exilibacterium tricleocarpae]
MNLRQIILTITAIFSSFTQAGNWTQESIAGMSVNLYTPTTAPALNDRRALMINLHGCAQSAADLKSGANWQASADQYGMVVAIPDAPGGGVIAGCWDYYGNQQSRNNKYNDNLIQLALTLAARPALNIDADQVYLSGLSSGATQTAVLACLAADVFAGVGINAGPAIGTSAFQIGSVATTAGAAENLCLNFAGTVQTELATQVASVIYGTADTLVATGYNDLNASIFASLYGAGADAGSDAIPGGGTETTWSDGSGTRVSLIAVAGMGHAWPAGQGSAGSSNYIDHASVNYPQVLTGFLFANNRRAQTNLPPALSSLQLQEDSGTILVTGLATDADGTVVNIYISIESTALGTEVDSFDLAVDGAGFFSGNSQALADGNYSVTVVVEDDQGATASQTATVRLGPAPPDSAPVLSELAALTEGACVTVSGKAIDPDDNLDSISASFDGGAGIAVTTTADGSFTLANCELGAGTHSVTITAIDSGGNSTTSAPIPFTLADAGISATLTAHIDAGRLDFTAYATCYLTYGSEPFTLFLGTDNRWSDNAGCIGPVQDNGGGGDPGNCTEYTASTAGHVLAGRAQLCALVSYCAKGSGDYLGLYSFFDSKTLAEAPAGYFTLGSCP